MDSWRMAVLYGTLLLLVIAGIAHAVCGIFAGLMVLAGAVPVSIATAYAVMLLLDRPAPTPDETQKPEE